MNQVQIHLYSMSGNFLRKILSTHTFPEGQHNLDIELDELLSGSYVIVLQVGDSYQAKNLIIQ